MVEPGHNSYRNVKCGVEWALRRTPGNPLLVVALEQLSHYSVYWSDEIIGMAGGHQLDTLEPKYQTSGKTVGDYLTGHL